MTRARALKQVIRARAAKTGERYTTARRHVLRELNQRGNDEPKGSSLQAPPIKTTKRSVSDASSLKNTGHPLDYWFRVLDRFGAVEKGHSASAKHLFRDHGVGGWYSQSITVAYERARGVRAVNQRCDGDFEVSASKVVKATTPQVIKAFIDTRQRKRWIAAADAALADALAQGIADQKSKGFVVRPDGLARFRYKWDDTTVQLYLDPKPGGKISIVVQHTKLKNAAAVEKHRAQWRAALASLASYFTD